MNGNCEYDLFYKAGNNPCSNGMSFNVSGNSFLYSLLKVDCACVCNSKYTGASDYFDMRLFTNETLTLSESCELSVLGVTILWSIVLAFTSFGLLAKTFILLYSYYKKGKKLSLAFQIGSSIHLIGVAMFFIVCILKLKNNNEYVFGTHVGITITLFFSMNLMLIGHHVPFYYMEEFFVGATRLKVNQEEAKLHLKQKQKVVIFSYCFYVITWIPIFIMLSVPKNGTRLSNTLIQVRYSFLCLCILYMITLLLGTIPAYRNSIVLVETLKTSIDGGKVKDELSYLMFQLAKISYALCFALILSASVNILFYGVYLIPVLFTQQTYLFIITGFLASDVGAINTMFLCMEVDSLWKKQNKNHHIRFVYIYI